MFCSRVITFIFISTSFCPQNAFTTFHKTGVGHGYSHISLQNNHTHLTLTCINITSLNQLMVWNSKVQRNSLSAFDRLSIFSTTSMSVRITGQPGFRQMWTDRHKLFYSRWNENKLVSKRNVPLPLPYPAGRQSPRGPPGAVSPHRVSGGEKMERDREETLAYPHTVQGETNMFVRYYTINWNGKYDSIASEIHYWLNI